MNIIKSSRDELIIDNINNLEISFKENKKIIKSKKKYLSYDEMLKNDFTRSEILFMKLNDEYIERTKGAGFTNLIDYVYNNVKLEDLDKIIVEQNYVTINGLPCYKEKVNTDTENLKGNVSHYHYFDHLNLSLCINRKGGILLKEAMRVSKIFNLKLYLEIKLENNEILYYNS